MTDTTTSAGPDAETLPELTVMGLFLADWEKTKANPTHGNLHYFGAVLGLFVQDYINRVDEVAADRDRLAAELEAARASQAAPLPVAELEAMRKDAQRYRWLRAECEKHAGVTIAHSNGYELQAWSGGDPDAAIDAQIAAPPSPGTPVREGGA